uniref:Uncharacterized protein n=1 Tax=Glossina austeni TaxID=7395 RepID=A0A1A9VFI5_GLOAU
MLCLVVDFKWPGLGCCVVLGCVGLCYAGLCCVLLLSKTALALWMACFDGFLLGYQCVLLLTTSLGSIPVFESERSYKQNLLYIHSKATSVIDAEYVRAILLTTEELRGSNVANASRGIVHGLQAGLMDTSEIEVFTHKVALSKRSQAIYRILTAGNRHYGGSVIIGLCQVKCTTSVSTLNHRDGLLHII